MRLFVSHTTTYRYRNPVGLQPHRMMLRPRDGRDLRILAHSLTCSPAAELVWSQDVFGNLVSTASFAEPASELSIASRLSAELTAEAWPLFPISPSAHAFPFSYATDEQTDLGALRAPQQADDQVAAWARAFVRSDPTDTLSLLKDINAGVMSAAAYRARDEEGTQTASETLRLASGSCRDLSALFIEAIRHLGFGARAVSGYLFEAGAPRRQPDTTHAWAEAYLPGAGWIAFDPTHGRVGGAGLIPLATGRCNSQIMPVVGAYSGAAEDYMAMSVEVAITADERGIEGP